MIALCLLLTACGGAGEDTAETLRERYQSMEGCTMEATVSCDQAGLEWEAVLRCACTPGGESTVEVLAPETIAGVQAVFSGTDGSLEFAGETLNAGRLSTQEISRHTCPLNIRAGSSVRYPTISRIRFTMPKPIT